jgi:hypothetical protein
MDVRIRWHPQKNALTMTQVTKAMAFNQGKSPAPTCC